MTRHDQRSRILESIATLSGFDLRGLGRLPDGRKPDVLRISESSGAVFLGEAKDTEKPNNKDTVRRLFLYMLWFKVISSHQFGSIFAICFGEENHAPGWTRTLRLIADEVGMTNYELKFADVGTEDFILALLPQRDYA